MKKIMAYFRENYMVLFKIYIVWQVLLQWVLAPVFPRMGTIGNICIVGFGAVIYLYDYLKGRILFKRGVRILPCLFWGAVLLSILVNYKMNFVDNMQAYAILMIEIFILLPAYADDIAKIKKDIFTFGNGVAILMFICSVIGFTLYVLDYPIYLYSHRFCGIFSNPNQSSVLSFFGMISSGLVLAHEKAAGKKRYKVFHITNIVLNFFMFTLSNSNTGKVMLFCAVATIGFFVTYHKVQKIKMFLRVLVAVGVMAVCVGGSYGVYSVTQDALAYVPGLKEGLNLEGLFDGLNLKDNILNKDDIDKKDFDRSEQEGGLNNNRFEIWREGFVAFKHSPIVGFGPRNVSDAVDLYVENPRSEIEAGGLHNMYIELLVTCGILGVVCFAAWALSELCPVAKTIFGKQTGTKRDLWIFLLISAGTISSLAMNMTESAMFFSNSAYSIYFWCLLGYLLSLVKLSRNS